MEELKEREGKLKLAYWQIKQNAIVILAKRLQREIEIEREAELEGNLYPKSVLSVSEIRIMWQIARTELGLPITISDNGHNHRDNDKYSEEIKRQSDIMSEIIRSVRKR